MEAVDLCVLTLLLEGQKAEEASHDILGEVVQAPHSGSAAFLRRWCRSILVVRVCIGVWTVQFSQYDTGNVPSPFPSPAVLRKNRPKPY